MKVVQSLLKLRTDPDTPLNRELATAAVAGDLERVKALLAQGADPDARASYELPPNSAEKPEWSPVALLARPPRPEDTSKFVPVFRMLAGHAKSLDAQDTRTGMTLLMLAIEMEDVESVQSLLARGAKTEVSMTWGFEGATALSMAVMNKGDQEKRLTSVIKVLLDAGAEVNVRYRLTPMGNPLYVEANRKAPKEAGTTPLMTAAQHGKTEVVTELLRRGADPKIRDVLGHDALWFATRFRRDDIVALLRDRVPLDLHQAARVGTESQLEGVLATHPDLEAKDARGETPLLLAALRDDTGVARMLIDAGATLDARDKTGQTALHRAAERGNIPLLRLLLAKGADTALEARGSYTAHATPLVMAVAQARADAVAVLLEHVKDRSQIQRAFAYAVARAGSMPSLPRESARVRRTEGEVVRSWDRIVAQLLGAGADVRADGSRVLFDAAFEAQPGLVKLLLDRGADVNARGRRNGGLEEEMSALMAAVTRIGMDESVVKGVQEGRILGPKAGAYGQSAEDALKVVTILLERGADVNQPNRYGQTPLHTVADDRSTKTAELLLRYHPDVDAADEKGRTPLMSAAAEGNLDLVRLLLRHGASVDARDRQGYSALMLTIDDGRNEDYRRSRAEIEKHMHGHGEAPKRIRPEELPNRDGHPGVVRLLLHSGANRKLRSKGAESALSLAKKNGFIEVVAILAER